MKATQAAAVQRYAAWHPDDLARRLQWRQANQQASQDDIAAMQEAQRVQAGTLTQSGDEG